MQVGCYEGRESLFQWFCEFADECLRQLLHGPGGNSGLLHLLGRDVKRLHPHVVELQLGSIVNVGVGELEPAVEYGRLSEDDIFLVNLVILIDILRAIEPHYITDAMSVSEVCDDTFLTFSHLSFLKAEDSSFDLHERHIL